MHSIKLISISFLALFMVVISSPIDAALKYQQDLTLTSWESLEHIEEMVQEFCDAASGDPDIKIIDVKYVKRKKNRKSTPYSAIITCHVSEIDRDLIRINGKIFQQKHDLVDNADTGSIN